MEQMKTWSPLIVRNATKYPEKLLEKRISCVFEENHYMNAYEYSLFVNTDLCYTLSNCMHSQGLTIEDTVTPFVMQMAMISNNVHNYAALGKIKWNEKTFQGVMRRPDFLRLLKRKDYDINGYEFGIQTMPKLIGTIIKKNDLIIADIISFQHFKKCQLIKDIFVS